MLQLIQPVAFRPLVATSRSLLYTMSRRGVHSSAYRALKSRRLPLFVGCALTVSAVLAFQTPVYLDAMLPEAVDETGAHLP